VFDTQQFSAADIQSVAAGIEAAAVADEAAAIASPGFLNGLSGPTSSALADAVNGAAQSPPIAAARNTTRVQFMLLFPFHHSAVCPCLSGFVT
jgi:hypothetical protein